MVEDLKKMVIKEGMEIQMPDLGIAFHPSEKKLRKISENLAKIILNFLREKKITLLSPTPGKLSSYLAKRMAEQGRFAGLVVSPLNSHPASPAGRQQSAPSDYFLKFPLGGKTARTLAFREAKVLHFLWENFPPKREFFYPKAFQIWKTPSGWALLSQYYQGPTLDKWLEKASKSEQKKMAEKIRRLLSLWENLLTDKTIPSFLFKKSAIHTWTDYYQEVKQRLKEHPEFSFTFKDEVLKAILAWEKITKEHQGKFVFAHRDFFGKNIIVRPDGRLAVVDFEHAAVIKNHLLGLNFDLANIIVQSYEHPIFQKFLFSSHQPPATSYQLPLSLNLCLIIQCLAKIAPVAQKMTLGGYQETLTLLKKTVKNLKFLRKQL